MSKISGATVSAEAAEEIQSFLDSLGHPPMVKSTRRGKAAGPSYLS